MTRYSGAASTGPKTAPKAPKFGGYRYAAEGGTPFWGGGGKEGGGEGVTFGRFGLFADVLLDFLHYFRKLRRK